MRLIITILLITSAYSRNAQRVSSSSFQDSPVQGVDVRFHPASDTLKPAKKTDSVHAHLQVSLAYETNDVYNGRKNTTVIPLVTPAISYIFTSGFEADLNVGYNIHDPSPQVNQYTVDLAYNFSPGDGHYTASITAARFFYNKQSGSTTAEQKGSFEVDNSYDFGFAEPGVNLSWIYGDGQDYGANISIQHEFDFDKGKLSFTPNVNLNAGTQNYYNSYYHERRYKVGKKDKKPVYEEVTVYGDVLNAGQFQVLDYEITAPLNYTLGRWKICFTPTYALPVNPADIRVTIFYQDTVLKTTMKKESLSNSFFTQIGLTYDF